MTLHVIDAKTLGSTILGSLEIESIAVNSTASWVYLGRGFSIDLTTPKLIACHMDTATGKAIEAPIFLPDLPAPNNSEFSIRISQISVDESKRLLYLSRVISGILKTTKELEEFEAITVYKLDETGRPTQIVKTCRMQVPDPQKGPNDDGIYSFEIHQNHLYAVGQRTNGILIYKLDDAGVPTTNPIAFFQTTACQQIKILNDKIYLGTIENLPNQPYFTALKVGVLSPNPEGIPIPTNLQSFALSDVSIGQYLDFQISNRGIFPQISRYITNVNRVQKRPLLFLPFNGDGFPVLPLQTLAQEIRALGVNPRNELWFAADDKYQDAIDGSEDSRGIKIQKHDSNESFVEKLKFARLVAVAENGTPVLLCDDVRAGEVLGEKSTISGWQIRFKVNVALPRLNPAKTFVLEGSPSQGAAVAIAITPGEWSEAVSLDPFLRSTRQPIVMRFGHKQLGSDYQLKQPELSNLEVEIEVQEGLLANNVKVGLIAKSVPGDVIEFLLPGYGVQNLPDLAVGESQLNQRFNNQLIKWADKQIDPVSRFAIASEGIVTGKVIQDNQIPLKGAIIRAFHLAGNDAIRLGQDTTDAEGRYTIYYTPLPDINTLNLQVSVSDASLNVLQSSESRLTTKPLEVVDLVNVKSIRSIEITGTERQVTGHILLDRGDPAAKLTLRFYSQGIGNTATRLGDATTDDLGLYNFAYPNNITNIEIRTVDTKGEEISLSQPKFNPAQRETLNLIAPTAKVQTLEPEHQRISTALTAQLNGVALSTLNETDTNRDITFLHQATGWDARFVAIAVEANKISTETAKLGAESAIPEPVIYGLLRAGLPKDIQQLAQISPESLDAAFKTIQDAGIVNLTEEQKTQTKTAIRTNALSIQRDFKTIGSLSNIGELLTSSKSLVNLSDAETQIFEANLLDREGTAESFWKKTETDWKKTEVNSLIVENKINGLKLQGKLAYLTMNNAALTADLHREIGSIDNLTRLVDLGLYKEEAWQSLIRSGKDGNAVKDENAVKALIPPAFGDESTSVSDRLNAYSQHLAQIARITYPTQVLSHMLGDEDGLKLAENHDTLKVPVQNFLQAAVTIDENFILGGQNLDKFIKTHEATLFPNPETKTDTIEAVKTLQRLTQITPSAYALKALAQLGFTSAHDITAFPFSEFMEKFGKFFRSREEAILVYNKAQQVSEVTFKFFTSAKQLVSQPIVGGTGSTTARTRSKDALLKEFPNLEALFGSLDYCECEHCRSVLSPAAYFVDILQLIDREKPASHQKVWDAFLTDWRNKHNGKEYHGEEFKYKIPYDALVERRPDLPNLQLTCENTNIALPYIDIVNEILEFYVANKKLLPDAYETEASATAELLAEPQNILPLAYDELKKAHYPIGLPFDLWLETSRQFFNYFETPLWQALETFGATDELFTAPALPTQFNRSTIWAEYLGISQSEYKLFTNANSLSNWYELYGFTSEAEAFTALKSAKTLSRKLGISYKELTEIVQTQFINPKLDRLVILYKLGISIEDVFRYKSQPGSSLAFTPEERIAFEKRLTDLDVTYAKSGFNDRTWLDRDFSQILVLADPNTGSNFDLVTLLRIEDRLDFPNKLDIVAIYTNHRDEYALAFLKLNLIVRLWRKLNWSIGDIDRSLQVFLPTNPPPANIATLAAAMPTALVYFAHLQQLERTLNVGKDSRQKLLCLWHSLFTTGSNSLYAQLFLVRSVLKTDTIFDDPLGRYLTQPNILLKDHLASVQGALNLTTVEISEILIDGGQDVFTAVLTLDTVSLLYRYQLLAKALKLTVSELISLKALSGLNPFAAINLNITKLTEDVPFSQTLKFIEMTTAMKNSNFHAEDLDYLCRHRFDPVGKYRSNPDELLNLVKSLATEIQRIRSEHAIPQDALSFTDEAIQQKLALVFPADVVQTFMAMWTGTIEYQVSQTALLADRLNPDSFNPDSKVKVSYDETRQIQKLGFRGVLTDAKKQQLIAANPSPILDSLLNLVQAQTKTFFSTNFEKSTIGTKEIGFLESTDFESLFEPIPANTTDNENQRLTKEKRQKLVQGFLPFLQQRLIQQLIVQSMANTLKTDLSIAETLLTNANLLAESSSSTRPLVDAFAALGAAGVSVTYVAAGNISQPAINVNAIDTAKKPNGAIAAKFEGYLEVPRTGAYRFSLVFTGVAAAAELKFNHQPNPFITGQGKANAADPDVTIGNFLELKAGVPYLYSFNAANLGNGDVELQVQSEDLPKGSIDRLTLYPLSNIDRVDRATILLKKTLQIVQGFGLTERELRYLLTNRADFSDLNFSLLPNTEISTISNDSRSLFQQFLRLANYTQLKKDLGDSENGLITIFENSRRAFPTELPANSGYIFNDLCQKLAELTRRKVETIKSVATYFDFKSVSIGANNLNLTIAEFNNERGIEKLWKVLQILEKFGVSIDPISKWIVPEPTAEIARDLRNTLKARYEEDTWQRIAQLIFDQLRQQKRDALVAYVMHNHPEGFQNVNQLFEFFLIDPEMEPVVQTSRLRLAISSVQLFIQRCLLNLEKFVHPSAIDSKHWQWMKRYRVWEANRKIFLFPENWLEPEFRDDKTHLFQELEGALLQGDVSNDLAEDAFFKYLKKLDELAQLEIVTMYIEEHPDPAQNILHVIGRTHNLPHKYFYRRYTNGMWTPWEPVTTEIEGDHIVAVMWHGRLNLFWVTFLEKAESKPIAPPTTTLLNLNFGNIVNSVQKIVEVQLNWSEYFQGQWTTRGSNGFGNPIRKEVDSNFDRHKVFIYVTQDADGSAVNINLQGDGEKNFEDSFRVVSKNSQPKKIYLQGSRLFPPYLVKDRGGRINKYENTTNITNNPLQIWFTQNVVTGNQQIQQGQPNVTKTILSKGNSFSLLMPSNTPALQSPEIASLASPFFYQDDRHTFFVEPSLTITKNLIEWDDWVLQKPRLRFPDKFRHAIPVPQIPKLNPEQLIDLEKIKINPESRQVFTRPDWAINPATVFTFQDRLIGERGSIDSKVLLNNNTKIENLVNLADGANNNLAPIEINTPAVITPNLDVLRNIVEIDPGNLLQPGDLINIIGNGGLDRVAIENLDRVNIDRQIFINQ
jgi:hypothetical protein